MRRFITGVFFVLQDTPWLYPHVFQGPVVDLDENEIAGSLPVSLRFMADLWHVGVKF